MDSSRNGRRTGFAVHAVAAGIGLIATALASAGPAATAATAATTAATRAAASGELVVSTDKGVVRGKVTEGVREFQGIPYAAPPVGEYRWGSPHPAPAWAGVRDATTAGAACAQNPGIFGEKASTSEDCLFVNVTSPQQARKLPVMVWIHGSGYRNGAGALYRPYELVRRGGVVVVTVNYRLGLFGFLDHPALDGGTAKNRSGNFGLEDQQAALRWVQRNAAAFGGDPRNITVFGESAGGVSTCSQLASPGAAGLFQRAIIQSGPCTVANWPDWDGTPTVTGSWLPRPRAVAEAQGLSVAADLGCADAGTAAKCLRELQTETLLPKSDFGFAPVYGGGGVLPLSPAQAMATGRFNKVPVMHGMTRHEYRTFEAAQQIYGVPPIKDEAEYAQRIIAYVGTALAPKVLARYPAAKYGSFSEAWSAVVTDATFARSVSDTSRTLARQVPTYAYEFADDNAPWVTGAPPPTFPVGAFHAAELQYQFDTDYFAGQRLTPSQERLAHQMTRYWTQFAKTGNPNAPGSPLWHPTTGDTAQILAPGNHRIRPMNFSKDHAYKFWQSIYG